MTNKQKKEIKCLDYFKIKSFDYSNVVASGKSFGKIKVKEDRDGISAEEAYFDIGDKGKKLVRVKNKAKLLELIDTKRWRLRMMEEYESGVLEGVTPYYTLLGFEEEPDGSQKIVPKEVMEFMAKTIFQGADKKIIEELYLRETTK